MYNWIQVKVQYGFHCHKDDVPVVEETTTKAPAHWGQWEEFSRCTGFGQIGKKVRERTCSDNEGKGTCGRLKERQERPCYLRQG